MNQILWNNTKKTEAYNMAKKKPITRGDKIPTKVDLDKLADVMQLYELVDDWYNEAVRADAYAGSEHWTTTLGNELTRDITNRWAEATGFYRGLFPWKDSFVCYLITKKRKEKTPEDREDILNEEEATFTED